ncbi:MAG: hypothetical protein FE78DRAFT_39703 [Acidomyces sp. 'richmondensis']|nr:MAG: hypothetical protein FE78DRAFT_39703 [Acidomyces sp. 'richmondensis']
MAQSKGIGVKGPFPCDTLFVANSRAKYDGIGFDSGITVQGGLPVMIATPTHGTAFDIVGENIASPTSSQNALNITIRVAASRASRRISEMQMSETNIKTISLDEIKNPANSVEVSGWPHNQQQNKGMQQSRLATPSRAGDF